MCEDCFDTEHKGFPTQKKFEEFQKDLDLKCRSKKIKILESANEQDDGFVDFKMYYKCNSCNEFYVMSIPDNAWRGYFLTEQNAIEYHNSLQSSDRIQNVGCWIFLGLILLLAAYLILK